MRGYRRAVGVGVAAILWAGVAAGQGLYWEVETTGGPTPLTAQAYAVPKMMKVVGNDGIVMLLRGDKEKLITIDTGRHTYTEISFGQLEASAKATQVQMEGQLKKLAPAERAKVEHLLQERGATGSAPAPPVVEIKKTGETKTIAGRACTKSIATSGGQTVLVAWTTHDLKGFDTLHKDWASYQTRFASLNGTLTPAAVARSRLDGFPMETESGPVKTVVTKIEARAIPASEFEVPPGYTQQAPALPRMP
jgi:hypothetical protein